MVTSFYLDTSVGIHVLLGHPGATSWFDEVTASGVHEVLSSRLLRTELTRTLRRLGQPLERREAVLDHLGTVLLDHTVLVEAEAIGPHVKTLDAIHLASALRSGIEDVVVTSHDRTMLTVARALGLAAHDPLTDGSPPP
ncbi:type II toxin-antitoxin system VapC family toxin [Lapillicoccus jejuensis]